MTTRERYSILTVLALCSYACGETAQQPVTVQAFAGGAGITTFSAGAWTVTLTQADVAIGPFYWCTTASASAELCPVATFEYAASASIDALAPAQAIGEAYGVDVAVRSVAYDYGISWLTTQTQASATSGAINGHSALFAGSATREARTLDFTLALDIVPQIQGTYAVQGARANAEITAATTSLTMTARPDRWWANVDFDSAAEADATRVVIADDSVAANTVRIGMTANAPLQFEWE